MLLQIDGTFLIAGLSFILFVIIMNWILYKPMVRILGEREEFYNKNNATVSDAKSKTGAILEDNKQKITASQKQAQELIKETSEHAKAQKAAALRVEKEACAHKVCDVQQKVDAQAQSAKSELYGEISNFVREIASKVLGKEVPAVAIEQHRIEEMFGGHNG